MVYILLWILTPVDEGGTVPIAAPRRLRRPSGSQLAGIGLVVIGIAVLLAIGGFWFGDSHGWPLVLAAVGFAVLWARSGDDTRGRWGLSRMGGPMQTLVTTPVSLPRLAIGTVLIAAGGGVFLAANTSVSAAGNMLLAFAVAVVGLGLLAGPWAWRARQPADGGTCQPRSSRCAGGGGGPPPRLGAPDARAHPARERAARDGGAGADPGA